MIHGRPVLLALACLSPALVSSHALPRSPAVPEGTRQEAEARPAGEARHAAEARKRQKVRDLMGSMGLKETAKRSLEQMISNFGAMGMTGDFLEKLRARFDVDAMVAISVDVYCERLEEKTVDAMVAFYETEEGRKLAAAMPDITVECVKRGQEYGKNLATEILQGK